MVTKILFGKKYDLNRFEPRAKRCSHCNPFMAELEPKVDDRVQCLLFGFIIDRSLSKREAVCSRKTKPLSFSVTLSETEVAQEKQKNLNME